MSYDVMRTMYTDWEPGKQVRCEEGKALSDYSDYASYQKWVKKASRRGNPYHALMLALAFDCREICDYTGLAHFAECYTAVETLSVRIKYSRRRTFDFLKELEKWSEIEIRACTGYCQGARRRHAGTNHYYLPLPPNSEPWGKANKPGLIRRRKTRATK